MNASQAGKETGNQENQEHELAQVGSKQLQPVQATPRSTPEKNPAPSTSDSGTNLHPGALLGQDALRSKEIGSPVSLLKQDMTVGRAAAAPRGSPPERDNAASKGAAGIQAHDAEPTGQHPSRNGHKQGEQPTTANAPGSIPSCSPAEQPVNDGRTMSLQAALREAAPAGDCMRLNTGNLQHSLVSNSTPAQQGAHGMDASATPPICSSPGSPASARAGQPFEHPTQPNSCSSRMHAVCFKNS